MAEWGDAPGIALRGAISPESLTPSETEATVSGWAREQTGAKKGGVLDAVIGTVTDPFFLLSLLTSWRFPVPSAVRVVAKNGKHVPENWFEVSKKFSSDTKRLGVGWQRLSPQGLFPGTDVWDTLVSLQAERVAFYEPMLEKVGAAVHKFEKASGRKMTQDDSTLMAMAMERMHERLPGGFGDHFRKKGITNGIFASMPDDPHFKSLVQDVRGAFDGAHEMMYKDPEGLKNLTKAMNDTARREHNEQLRSLGEMGVSADEVAKFKARGPQVYKAEDLAKKLPDYWHHLPVKDLGLHRGLLQNRIAEHVSTVQGLSSAEKAAKEAAIMRDITSRIFGAARTREHHMLPAYSALAAPGVAQYLKPGVLETLKETLAGSSLNNPILEYSTNLWDVVPGYAHTAASAYAWTTKGHGQRLYDAAVKFKDSGDQLRYDVLMGRYVPLALGRMTPNQANRVQGWANTMLSTSDWLKGPTAEKWLPKGARETLSKWLTMDDGRAAYFATSKSFTNYLYLSTLGLNPAASLQNLMQPLLTSAPLGLPIHEGYQSVFTKVGDYVGLRQKKKDHVTAFREAFADYHAAGIPMDPEVDQMFSKKLGAWYDGPGAAGLERLRGTWGSTKDKLMGMFTGSELLNRLVTFESARIKGGRDLRASLKQQGATMGEAAQKKAVMDFARQSVVATQFVGGTASQPYWLTDMPKAVTQLVTFPAKFFEFGTSTAFRAGSAQDSIGGINPGTFARMYMYSQLGMLAAKSVLGIDVSDALLDGATPTPRGIGPFAPLPMVPPIMSILGAPAMDIAKGDYGFEETKKLLPLAVPGGVSLSRLVSVLPGGEGAAQMMGKRYVDYSMTTPDGRHPQYTADGNLIGYLSPTQIAMQGLGLGNYSDVKQEQQVYAMLLKNRDRIRQWKRDYRTAVLNGQMGRAESIDREFQVQFPGVQLREMIKPQEFEADRMRREVPRLEKILDTLPPEVRPYYAQAIQTSLMALGPEFLGMPEGGLTSGATAKSRQRLPKSQSFNPSNRGVGGEGSVANGPLGLDGGEAEFAMSSADTGAGFSAFASF